MLFDLRRFYHLICISTYAQLKAEAHRSYLGYLWWLLEPLLNTFLFYALFFLFLGKRTADYLQFLLIGTILWQWIQTTIQLGVSAILDKAHLLRQIKVPLALFPITKTASNTAKFLIIYALLLIYLIFQGHTPTLHWFLIPPLLILHTAILLALVIPLALLMPFAPDIKTIIDAILRFLMLLSGIFFSAERIPPHLTVYFYANPFAHIIESHRSILIHNSAPTLQHWLYPAILILLCLPIHIVLLRWSDGRIPKILK